MSDKCEKRSYDRWYSGIRCSRDAKVEVQYDGHWKKFCAQHAVRYKRSGFVYRVLSANDSEASR